MLKKIIVGILCSISITATVTAVVLGINLKNNSIQLQDKTVRSEQLQQKINIQDNQIKKNKDDIDALNKKNEALSKQLEDANSQLKQARASLKFKKSRGHITKKELTSSQDTLKKVTTKSEPKKKKANTDYNAEYDLLYKLVEAEAGANNLMGREAVADVILNRVHSNKYPNSLTGVMNQYAQFEPVYNGTVYNMIPTPTTIKAVNNELAGHRVLPAYVLNFVDNDLDKDNPLWHDFDIYAVYGDNTFLVAR